MFELGTGALREDRLLHSLSLRAPYALGDLRCVVVQFGISVVESID